MKKLNCNQGNYQCGGKCQRKSWNCSKNASPEMSEQLNATAKLIKSREVPHKEELINFLNERKEKGIDKEPQIPVINEEDFNKIIQEGFKNKDAVINEPHLAFDGSQSKRLWRINEDPIIKPVSKDYLDEYRDLLSNSQLEKIIRDIEKDIMRIAPGFFRWIDTDINGKKIKDYNPKDYKISAKDMAKILNIGLKDIKPMFDPNEPNQKKLDGNWKEYGRDGLKLKQWII